MLYKNHFYIILIKDHKLCKVHFFLQIKLLNRLVKSLKKVLIFIKIIYSMELQKYVHIFIFLHDNKLKNEFTK